ncbi:MAG TPA: hypothetical protein VMT96_00125 [Candidatus Bathyarchaeia archaeon]|nr:hypothetical protein [Candidatus Bathyarchaeia archaeon]
MVKRGAKNETENLIKPSDFNESPSFGHEEVGSRGLIEDMPVGSIEFISADALALVPTDIRGEYQPLICTAYPTHDTGDWVAVSRVDEENYVLALQAELLQDIHILRSSDNISPVMGPVQPVAYVLWDSGANTVKPYGDPETHLDLERVVDHMRSVDGRIMKAERDEKIKAVARNAGGVVLRGLLSLHPAGSAVVKVFEIASIFNV